VIYVSEEEVVDGSIPVSGILIPRNAIPPIAIKATIRKSRELGEDIETAFPDNIPCQELFEEERKKHVT